MAIQAQAGQTVKITVKKIPLSAGGKKTLARVFLMDTKNRRYADERENKILDIRGWGGRLKPVQWRGSVLRVPKIGASCSIKASSAALADLKSIEKCVEVAAV